MTASIFLCSLISLKAVIGPMPYEVVFHGLYSIILPSMVTL